jgi:hypothetical protein
MLTYLLQFDNRTSIRKPALARDVCLAVPKNSSTPVASFFDDPPPEDEVKVLCKRAERVLNHPLDVENVASVD